MPTFEITSPDGRKFRVTGPDGASKQEALDQVRARVASEDIKNESTGQYLKETAKNIPGSAVKAAKDIYQTVSHPVEAVENLGSLAKGISQKLGLSSGTDSVQYADAAWDFLKQRYGSVDALKKSFHDDPVGVAMDALTVAAPVEAAGARLPGIAGEATRVAGSVARAPIRAVTKPVGGLASQALGLTTGAGSEAVSQAFRAGKEGGATSQAFTDQMRGAAPSTELVSDAKAALSKLRQQRGENYVRDIASVKESTKVLPFAKIDAAVDRVANIKNFKGKDTQRSTASMREKISQVVDEWRSENPAEFHTAEGLDALKQTIGDLRDDADFGKPARKVADEVYHSIRQTIVDAFPKYGETMKGYETATQAIKEIEQTLSVKPNANVDASLRKITAALRDNVNTNFGRRTELVKFLASSGAPHLLAKIAGQALRSAAPRGIVGRLGALGITGEALMSLASADPVRATKIALLVLVSSPRVVGETAHLAGQASRLPFGKTALGLRAVSPESNLGQ